MRSKEEINKIMDKIYPEFRYRWCDDNGPCACMGCVNWSELHIQEEMGVLPITKAEWKRWVESHKTDDEKLTIIFKGIFGDDVIKKVYVTNKCVFSGKNEISENLNQKGDNIFIWKYLEFVIELNNGRKIAISGNGYSNDESMMEWIK